MGVVRKRVQGKGTRAARSKGTRMIYVPATKSRGRLAFLCLNLEMVIAAGFILWMNSFLSEGLSDWFNAGVGSMNAVPHWFHWVCNASYLAAVTLIEPMYAAAGFALYINSPTHLEGWDIEVAFRRMSGRLSRIA